jgi:hypothetical protein
MTRVIALMTLAALGLSEHRSMNRSTLMALSWGNPATVRNIGDGAVSTHECRIFINDARISGTDDTYPRADGFTDRHS